MHSYRCYQHNVTFADRESGKRAITERLGPTLLAAEEAGQLDGWWFMNKQPWPLRYRAAQPSPMVLAVLNGLVDDDMVKSWLPGPGHLGRRETAVLLISAMMRTANLDWFEQGDVWAKAAALRPAADSLTRSEPPP